MNFWSFVGSHFFHLLSFKAFSLYQVFLFETKASISHLNTASKAPEFGAAEESGPFGALTAVFRSLKAKIIAICILQFVDFNFANLPAVFVH